MKKINISIRFFAMMREIVGKSKISIEINENSSINVIMSELADSIPDLRNVLFMKNTINESLVFVLNGQTVKLLTTIISEGDELTILPPSGGGLF